MTRAWASALIACVLFGSCGAAFGQSNQRNAFSGVGNLRNVGNQNLRSNSIGLVGTARLSANLQPAYGGARSNQPPPQTRGLPGFPGSFQGERSGQGGRTISSFRQPISSSVQPAGSRTAGSASGPLDVRGQRAADLMSRITNQRQPLLESTTGLQSLRQRSPGLANVGGRALAVTKPADRYGIAFARGPAFVGAELGGQPLPAVGTREVDDFPHDVTAVQGGPIDLIAATDRDADHYKKRAVERLFGSNDRTGLRLAQLDFDKVRSLRPDDPQAYLGATLAAVLSGDRQYGLSLWRQCLRRFEASHAPLDALWFDFSEVSGDAVQVQIMQERSNRMVQDVRKELQAAALTSSLTARRASLVAYLAWKAGDRAAAIEQARIALDADLQQVQELRSSGIALLYQKLRETP